ncbi:MAG: phospholipase D-like domain-containing protein [Myxococcota bacterium]
MSVRPLVAVFAASFLVPACNSGFGPAPEPNLFFRSSTRTSCEDAALVRFVNEPSITAETLRSIGVHPTGADNLIAKRDGYDGLNGTSDDFRFETVAQVDAVSWIGKVSIDAMYAQAGPMCDIVVDPEYACMETTVSELLSAADTTEEDLLAIGVYSRAAAEIVKTRNGPDGVPATLDDVRFNSLDDVDSVPQVGPQTIADLLAWGLSQCQTSADVVFSPQGYDESHLAEITKRLDQARRSVDVAMYSFSDSGVKNALVRAADRGVKVRLVFEGASEDRKAPQGTTSAWFEDRGIEVRWINKIMHHKFGILDGPRDHASQAGTGTLVTGSGNWSNSAGTRFDENTLFIEGDARLNLQFQREFDLMWENGRAVPWNETLENEPSVPVLDADLSVAEGASALFTSANFEAYDSSRYGPTFRNLDGSSRVRDALVQLIEQADTSIWIASGHLRSRPIYDALVAKRLRNPEIDIRVYLDGQEYISQGYHTEEQAEYQACLAAAQDDGDVRDCQDNGYYFGIALANAGIDVRYKYYAYRWDHSYADQMHHKYLVIDREIVATGSYNLSPNAEFDTFENVVMLHAGQYRSTVEAFANNFDQIWNTNRDDDLAIYWSYVDFVTNTNEDFPIVFTPMALTHSEVEFLKNTIWENCPDINSDAYRQSPGAHRYCER